MSDDVRIEIDYQEVVRRLGTELPDITRNQVVDAFRQIVGTLEGKIITNIHQMFRGGHSGERPQHLSLEDSILATVTQEGDLVVGSVGYDLEETPYARIQELGGDISPHTIIPRAAAGLKIPISTFLSGEAFQGAETTEDGLFVLAFQANNRGAHIAAHYFMLAALADLSREIDDDVEGAVIRSITSAGF